MHIQPEDYEERTCCNRGHSRSSLDHSADSMHAAIEAEDHEQQKRQTGNDGDRSYEGKDSDSDSDSDSVSKPSSAATEEQDKSKPTYPLPPTEIHDGRLFRKVG